MYKQRIFSNLGGHVQPILVMFYQELMSKRVHTGNDDDMIH